MSADGTDTAVNTPTLGVDPSTIDAVLAHASDIVLSLSKGNVIQSVRVNPRFTLGRDGLRHWVGRDLRDVLTRESAEKFESRVLGVTTLEASTIQLNHIDGENVEFPIDYTHTPPRADGGILMLGRSLQAIAETQQTLTRMHIELERERDRQRQFEIKYRLLLQQGRDPIMLLDADSSQITDVSDALLNLLSEKREALVGKLASTVFDAPDLVESADLLQALMASGEDRSPLRLTRPGGRKTIAITAAPYRVVGDRVLLCRALTSEIAEGVSDDLASTMTAFYVTTGEAIAVSDASGTILTANESFLKLSGAASPDQLSGASIDTYLSRGGIDLKIILKTLANNRQINGYQTSIREDLGTETKVELSASLVDVEGEPRIVFLLRDGRSKSAHLQSSDYLTDQAARNIVDLIGGVDLKDIVGDTTEVVERMCLEVALEITNNNRVAAAKMLGLSRQSLYVKIRKFGI